MFAEFTTDGVNEYLNGSLVVVLAVVKYALAGVELAAKVGRAFVAAAMLNAVGVAYVDGGRYVVVEVLVNLVVVVDAVVVGGEPRYWERPRWWLR